MSGRPQMHDMAAHRAGGGLCRSTSAQNFAETLSGGAHNEAQFAGPYHKPAVFMSGGHSRARKDPRDKETNPRITNHAFSRLSTPDPFASGRAAYSRTSGSNLVSSLTKRSAFFDRMTKHRPQYRLTIRQRVRVLQHHWIC
jgi:hypothetical protein